MTFGDKLTELRVGAEMTQEQLATAAGLPVATIRNYEQDRIAKVPFGSVLKIASALGVSCETFAKCEGLATPEAPAPKKKGGKKK